MICDQCNTENEARASFCIKCGGKLPSVESGTKQKSRFSDTIVIMVVLLMMLTKVFWAMLPFIHRVDWHNMKYFNSFFNFLWAAAPLLLAFTVKNKVWKIVLIVIGGIYALMTLIRIIIELTTPMPNFNF